MKYEVRMQNFIHLINFLILVNTDDTYDMILTRSEPIDPELIQKHCVNASDCKFNQVCTTCQPGFYPNCTQAECVKDKCKINLPCSAYSSSNIPLLKDTCTRNEDCPHSEYCGVKCPDGYGPRCASAQCVDGQCVDIKPCSQQYCRTKAKCPYNKNNCMTCSKGEGPSCEEPLCKNGICSIVPPCFKQQRL